MIATTLDEEDQMGEQEWEEYYEENLSTSDAGVHGEEIEKLKQIQ